MINEQIIILGIMDRFFLVDLKRSWAEMYTKGTFCMGKCTYEREIVIPVSTISNSDGDAISVEMYNRTKKMLISDAERNKYLKLSLLIVIFTTISAFLPCYRGILICFKKSFKQNNAYEHSCYTWTMHRYLHLCGRFLKS